MALRPLLLLSVVVVVALSAGPASGQEPAQASTSEPSTEPVTIEPVPQEQTESTQAPAETTPVSTNPSVTTDTATPPGPGASTAAPPPPPPPPRRERNATFITSADGQSADCDFTTSACWWRLDGAPYRHYSWLRGSPETAFYRGGPATDGAGEVGPEAGYVFVDASVFRDVYMPDFYLSGWMTSPERPPPGPAGRCLQFRYNTAGASVHSLRVLRVDHIPTIYPNDTQVPTIIYSEDRAAVVMRARNATVVEVADIDSITNRSGRAYIERLQNVTEILWESRELSEGTWKQGKVTYNTGYRHRIVFEVVPALASQASRGHAAIDDVSLTQGACDEDCGFEQDLCRWSNTAGDDFDWQLGRGSKKRVTGPIRDQASSRTFSRIGGYVYIDGSFPRRPGDVARLESTVFETSEPLCLNFYTNMFGAGVGRLSVFQVIGGATPHNRTLWEVSGGSGSPLRWELGRVTLSATDRFKVQLEATVGEPGAADIAVDTIRVEEGACPAVPSSAGRDDASCGFSDDTCGWTLDSTFLWSRGGTSGGWDYVYPPGNQPTYPFISFDLNGYEHVPGAQSAVTSPPIGPNRQQVCVSFWVYIASHIATMPRLGSLQLLLINSTSNATSRLWRVDNHQRHGWLRARAPFSANTPVRLTLQGIRGPGVSGVLGVDDIVVYDGACETLPAGAAVSELDCWFDRDECGWSVAPVAESGTGESWRAAAAGFGVPQLLDHTHRIETGYEYFDPFNQRTTARLLSPSVPAETRLCLSLWYTCIGGVQQDATLSLRRQTGADNATSELLWQVTQGRSGHTGRRYIWHYGQVSVAPAAQASTLVIEAVGMQAGWALDDLMVVEGDVPCDVRPQWASPMAAP